MVGGQKLPKGIFGPIKNKPVQLPNGDILCPTSNETDEKPSAWAIYFERTADLGKTWTRTELLHDGVKVGAIQPSILDFGGDKLMALGRSKQGKVFQITSDDAGKTWGEISLTDCRIRTPAPMPSRSPMDVTCSSTTTPPKAAAR
jgi:Neuraminidase (sialidase)